MTRILTIIALLFAAPAWAHSGRLNSQGCHGGSQPHHCHRSASEMVPSSSGGSRLRCSSGSQSNDCVGTPANEPDVYKPNVTAPANAYVVGGNWYCELGFRRNGQACIRE